MKKLIIILILTALTAQAGKEIWIHGTRPVIQNNYNKIVGGLVELQNTQTTNSYTVSNVTYYVTNYVHTTENTNNVLWRTNCRLTNSVGGKVWCFGTTDQKIVFPDVEKRQRIKAYVDKTPDLYYDYNISFGELMQTYGYGWRDEAWFVPSIPKVDDGKKVQERKSEYQKEKKK